MDTELTDPPANHLTLGPDFVFSRNREKGKASRDRISGCTMLDPTESELLANVARGDTEAFGQLYDRLAGPLFSLAMKILRDPASAEDVVQEVFVQVWGKASAYDATLGRPLTWALTLVRNRAIDRLRATQRGQRLMDAAADEHAVSGAVAEAPGHSLLNEETARLVRTALTRLGPEQRQTIELAYFGGLTQTEIAAALQTPLGTVKARTRRGMLQLREDLEFVL